MIQLILNVTKFYRYLLMVTVLMLLVLSCDNKNEIVFVEKHKIISHLLDSQTIPIMVPPPPPPFGVVDTLSAERDSIVNVISSDDWKNQKLNIAIVEELAKLEIEEISNEKIPSGFEFILSSKRSVLDTKPIQLSYLKPTKKHLLIYAPPMDSLSSSPELRGSFDVLVGVSEICFNATFDKAVLSFGKSFSKLNGASYFLFLEKENDNWKVVKSILNGIS